MTTINLLPWREKSRRRQQRAFLKLCFVVVIGALFLNGVWYFSLHTQVKHQKKRVFFLQQEVQHANVILSEKNKTDAAKKDLMAQISILEDLHNQRFNIVEMMKNLPTLLPSGVYITEINVQKNQVELRGEAATELQASEFVKRLTQKTTWKAIQLQELTSRPIESKKILFRLRFQME